MIKNSAVLGDDVEGHASEEIRVYPSTTIVSIDKVRCDVEGA